MPETNPQHQAAVDMMAKALHESEARIEGSMIYTGDLVLKMRVFRKECDLHKTLTAPALKEIGDAMAALGEAAAAANRAHSILEDVCKKKKLPKPSPNSGGGGGKGG